MTDDADPAADQPVLMLHRPEDSRYTLRFVSDDETRWRQKALELAQSDDAEPWTDIQRVECRDVYLVYARMTAEGVPFETDSTEEIVDWLDTHFSQSDLPILEVVVEIQDGIFDELEAEDASPTRYKQMDLERLPDILNRVQWRQAVPTVGAELLSRFILAHPLPNMNHRTAIGLLDRYLTSYDAGFAMPDTGEEGRWFEWARDYIYASKRLLTLRNHYPQLDWAARCGYAIVERKEGIRISLTDIDFEREDFRAYYTDRHLVRSRQFVDTVLEEADATHLREEQDDGKRAFADRLRGT